MNAEAVEALARALYLGITAETDDQEEQASDLAVRLASGMTGDEVDAARVWAASRAGL